MSHVKTKIVNITYISIEKSSTNTFVVSLQFFDKQTFLTKKLTAYKSFNQKDPVLNNSEGLICN